MLGNRDQAEDLVQETFVRAWQNFDRFELGTNFKAWIFQILTYLYLNERRSAKSREITMDCSENTVQSPPEVETVEADPVGTDWEALYPSLVGDEFKQALERLSDDQRAILMLVTLGELSYQECADALGIPIGTVMSRLFRARKQLQNDLYGYARERGLIGRDSN
jgi:RNA polymerase sigma-70 factor (ECF subfamily)